jgi:hypothetical protein
MRLPIALGILASGCTVVDHAQIPLVAVHSNRVYLSPSQSVTLRWKDELDNYACINGPITCGKVGIGWDCRCPP